MDLDIIAANLKTKIEALTGCTEAVVAYNIDKRSNVDLEDNLYSLTLGSSKIDPFSNVREMVTQDFIVTLSSVFTSEAMEGDTERRELVKTLTDKAQVLAVNVKKQIRSLHSQAIDLDTVSTEINFYNKTSTVAIKLTLPIKFLRKGN